MRMFSALRMFVLFRPRYLLCRMLIYSCGELSIVSIIYQALFLDNVIRNIIV